MTTQSQSETKPTVVVEEADKASDPSKTVFTFPEYGFAVEAKDLEEATKIAQKQAKESK